ncbi:MAG: S41 family peptidase [Vicinamibacterales bacterium]
MQTQRRSVAESRLVRYPHHHAGRIAFTYLADIWSADENGQNVRRLTVNRARDVYPRFSPDGKWIAFSSDRNGSLDVFVMPAEGGTARALTSHSADDTVLTWSRDSRAILFASNRGEDFAGKLYTVGLDGGMPVNAGPDMGVWAAYSPDGTRLAINRHGQVYWRKYYRGANATEITLMDIAAKRFTEVTDFDGLDSWPMWARNGYIYFVSDRQGGGLTNIWRVPESGGRAEQVTTFTAGDVRWPSMSDDGRVVMFEHDFGIWKLDVATHTASPVPLAIAAETQENTSDVRTFNSEVDDYDLDPSGQRIAFSVHGEVFTAPAEDGELTQITEGAARDREVLYSPDGKRVAFVSDRTGHEEIYVASPDGSGEALQATNVDALKLSFAWSPDSTALAIASSDFRLRRYDIDSRRTTELASSRYGNIGAPAWSPDGRWIAYAKPDQVRTNDIYLVPSAGATSADPERRVTVDSYNDTQPHFAPDGRKLYFVRGDRFADGPNAAAAAPQIHAMTLEREERDPDDPAERTDAARPGTQKPSPAGATGASVAIDWAGLKRRTRQVTRMPHPVTSYVIAPDSRTLAFVVNEPSGTRTQPAIYTIRQDGRRPTRLTAGRGDGDANDEAPQPRGGGPAIAALRMARDGRTLFFRERRHVYSVALPSPGSQPGAGSGQGRDGQPRRVSFTAKVRIDRPAEWAQMFGDAWRTMKYRFYDPKMHGHDWDAVKAKYEPLVQYVGDRQELLNLINEMIGELNASHTGAGPPPGGRDGVSTGYLGLDLEPDARAGRYRVTHVYEDGPADKDWVKVAVGDYLLAINGKPVKAGDEYWQLLNHRLNRKVAVSFSSTPSEAAAWVTKIAPVQQNQQNQLRYERWVRGRRAEVDTRSAGRIGYLHIQAMNAPSLRRFQKELRENRHKQALVIDQRWNGGGNIDQELLGILVQREYQIWQPRGTEPSPRPFSGFFGPKIVLQNWRSASNAEMFPAGFRALGLGKVVGTPTAGAVIGTGSYSLIDGSTVRTPGTGVFLADAKRTNMENYGVPPDILVENTPEDHLAGRDRQLEVAVDELLKQIGPARTTSSQ